MPGTRGIRMLDASGGLYLAVSTVPASQYDEAALARGLEDLVGVGRRAVAHESVVEHFLSSRAVLPMQLFALFTSDERALAHVASDRRRIERILTRLERKHEWGLRLTFDEQSAREVVEQNHDGLSKKTGGSKRIGPTSGAAYLARKRDLLDVTRAQLMSARTAADRLFTGMTRAAAQSLRRRSTEQAAPGSRLLLDAAFLVATTRADGFRAALRRQARTLPAGVVVSLTGPWPPYNFIDVPARPRPSSGR